LDAPIENLQILDATLIKRNRDGLAEIGYIQHDIPITGISETLQALDFDDDGDLDMISVDGTTAMLFTNTGGSPPAFVGSVIGSLTGLLLGSPPGLVRDISAADLTGDGLKDVIVVNSETIQVFENQGGQPPAFLSYGAVVPFWDWQLIRAADYDGDGQIELFMLGADLYRAREYDPATHRTVPICSGDTDYFTFDDTDASAAAFGRSPVDVRDVNDDGNPDVLFTQRGIPRVLYDLCAPVDVGMGAAWEEDSLALPVPTCEGGFFDCAISGDEHLPPGQNAWCRWNTETSACELNYSIGTAEDLTSNTVRLADVDGNGWVDVVARRCDFDDVCELVWLKSYGNGRMEPTEDLLGESLVIEFEEEEIIDPGIVVENITIEDLDLDGADEIVLFGPETGTNFVYLRYDLVTRTFEQKTLLGNDPRFVVARDLESDTDVDLFVWPRSDPGMLQVFENQTVIEFDTEQLTIRGDGDGVASAMNGVPFSASIADGIATFRIAGDLDLGTQHRRVIRAVGSNALSIRVANDVILDNNVGFDVSADGLTPGPGGGASIQSAAVGGSGGEPGDGGARGLGGARSYGGTSISIFPGIPGRGEGLATFGSDGGVGDPGQAGEFGGIRGGSGFGGNGGFNTGDGLTLSGGGGGGGGGGNGRWGLPNEAVAGVKAASAGWAAQAAPVAAEGPAAVRSRSGPTVACGFTATSPRLVAPVNPANRNLPVSSGAMDGPVGPATAAKGASPAVSRRCSRSTTRTISS
jgi:hypothetical protein